MNTTEPGSGPAGSTSRRGPVRAGLLGAIAGVGALAGGLVLLTGGAGAQPTVVGSQSAAGALATDEASLELDGDEGEAYFVCIDDVLSEAGIDEELELDPELTDAEWEAIDSSLEACDSLMPEEWAELEEAYEAYEACLVDNGILAEDAIDLDELDDIEEAGIIGFIETEDGSTIIEFGEGDGEVTVTQADGELTVASTGDVTIEEFDWEALEVEFDESNEAFAVCEGELEGIEALDIDELDGDWDDDEWVEGELVEEDDR